MEEMGYYEETFNFPYLWACIQPTLSGGYDFAKTLVGANILLRLLLQYTNCGETSRHLYSLLIGTSLLYKVAGAAFFWTIGLSVGSYAVICAFSLLTEKRRGLISCFLTISFLVLSEILVVDPKMWQKIRGIQMIAAMKVMSVAIDVDRGLYKVIPHPIHYTGYLLCPANCILGPWLPFQNYKSNLQRKFINQSWVQLICKYLVISGIFLIFSNCIVPMYISDDMPKWIVAYRDAQSFRMSHYFISYLSIVTMVCAGFELTNNCQCELEITKPYYIELPRSLVQVVVYWNIPMHHWLKHYVFKSCKSNGSFISIFVTYAISSLLHGLNFQLSSVLLSIGIFSYVEYKIRSKLALLFSCCCLVNACSKSCNHIYKGFHLFTLFINFLFSILTLIHLAYLGVMFEASFSIQESGFSFGHTVEKWRALDFGSHIIAIVLYIVSIVL